MNKLRVICAISGALALLFSNLQVYATIPTTDLTFGGLISEDTIFHAGHQSISTKYANSLNMLEYENEDGTRTVYSFNDPIKYIDEDGVIRQINNRLTRSILHNSWKNRANWYGVSISNDVKQGVRLSCYDASILAVPVLAGNKDAYSRQNDDLLHSDSLNFQGESENIAYTLSNTGYNTYITARCTSSFSMDISGNISSAELVPHGVKITMSNGCTATYSLVAFDLNAQPFNVAEVQISLTPFDNGSYRLTLGYADKAIPKNQSINMAITTAVATTTSVLPLSKIETIVDDYHEDASVYSNYPSNNYGNAIRCLVGVDGTMGKSRSYFRFDMSQLSDIPYNRILSANYRIRELTGHDSSFQAVAYIVQTAWSETGITWSNRPNCFDEKLATVNVEWGDPSPSLGSRAYYDFYITSAVMAWLQGVPNRGIMVKSRVESNANCRAFASSEYDTYNPRLSITYSTKAQNMDNIGINNETEYYIKNKRSKLYLTATGTTSGSSVVQKKWDDSSSQKWTVTSQGNGYYKLSPRNASQKALDNRDSSNANIIPMQLKASSSNTSQQFKFIRNWDGSYQIVSKITNDARGLCAQDNNTDNGGVICQRSHTINWVKSDDWTLEPVKKESADIYSFTLDDGYGINTSEYAPGMLNPIVRMGFAAYNRVDRPSSFAYSRMSSVSIWGFTGHGGPGCVQFKDGFITALESGDNYYRIIDKPHNALSKLLLAFFASCETGLDDTTRATNMVGLTYQRGAHFVISHTDWTSCPNGDIWVQKFLEYCSLGQTIYEATDNADKYMYDNITGDPYYGNAVQRHMLGDNSLCLYPQG